METGTIVKMLYGEQYNQAGSVLMIHIWAALFVFLGLAYSKYLTTENFTKKSLYRYSFGAVINIFLNYILIPSYGINGAAIATLLGHFVAHYGYDIIDKDLHHQLKMKTKSFFPVHIVNRKK